MYQKIPVAELRALHEDLLEIATTLGEAVASVDGVLDEVDVQSQWLATQGVPRLKRIVDRIEADCKSSVKSYERSKRAGGEAAKDVLAKRTKKS